MIGFSLCAITGSSLAFAMTVSAGLRTLSSSLALLLRADCSPIIPRNLSHGSAKHFRLTRALNRPVQSRVSNLCFSDQRIETRSDPRNRFHAPFARNQHELERERQQRIQDAPNGTVSSAGTSWPTGPAPCRKVLTWKSKANCAITTILPRKPIAACAWRRFMPTPSWRWTARTDSPFLLLNQSQPTNPSTDRFCWAAIFTIAAQPLFQSALCRDEKEYLGGC
jgi:hypothetical protein